MDLIASIAAEYKALTGESSREYAEDIYQHYELLGRSDVIGDALVELTALRKASQRCEAGLLQLAGVGDEYLEAERVGKAIQGTMASMEDLMCYALGGYSDVIDAYRRKALMFQSA